MEKPVQTLAIGTVISIIAGGAGIGVWYDGTQEAEHEQIQQTSSEKRFSDNLEVTLELISAKLKLYLTIKESRPLTPEEEADEEYLKTRRAILLAEQAKQER